MNLDELDIEPEEPAELEAEPEPGMTLEEAREALPSLELEPEPEPSTDLAPTSLMQILPADFPLPLLTKFVPDVALRQAAEQAAAYALGVEVSGPEGLERADLALTTLRTSQKAIEDHFEEPVGVANRLHKQLTSVRGEWLERGQTAIRTVGNRIYTEKTRLDTLEREARRKAQEEADRAERERIRKEREAAEKAKAPAPVVEQLKQQEKTATAPPVQAAAPAPTLKGVSTVTTWKARIAGTPACDVPLPDIEALSPAQRLEVLKLLKAIVDGRAPMAAITLNDSYLNKRAKADKSTLAIPGIESFEEGSVRARGSRAK